MSIISRILLVAVASAALSSVITAKLMSSTPCVNTLTSLEHPKARGEEAFVLEVTLIFSSAEKATELLKAWTLLADHCMKEEAFLFSYEASLREDKNAKPNEYVIIERYASKQAYLHEHKKGRAFHTFREMMRRMQDENDVQVTGKSYVETGLGFV